MPAASCSSCRRAHKCGDIAARWDEESAALLPSAGHHVLVPQQYPLCPTSDLEAAVTAIYNAGVSGPPVGQIKPEAAADSTS